MDFTVLAAVGFAFSADDFEVVLEVAAASFDATSDAKCYSL